MESNSRKLLRDFLVEENHKSNKGSSNGDNFPIMPVDPLVDANSKV